MRIEAPMAFTPRTLHRNRLLLAAALLACLPALGIGLGRYLADGGNSAPLLMTIDDLRLGSTGPVVQAPLQRPSFGTDPAGVSTLFASHPDAMTILSAVSPAAVATATEDSTEDGVRWFNGRPARAVRTIIMDVTAYSPDERSCGASADGITASGYSVWTNGMKLAAADTTVLPLGSLISVPGYDGESIIPVLDRGGAIKGKRLDLLYPTHEQARRWGRQSLEVTVWEYADGQPNDFVPRYHRGASVSG